MFETYNEIGINSIQITDIVNGVASFFMVALGGVFIGDIYIKIIVDINQNCSNGLYYIFRSNMGILNRFSYKIHRSCSGY